MNPHSPGASPEVLIVDDSAPSRIIIRSLVQLEGHRCIEAADGPQALEILKEKPISLVLLDVMMGGMSGLEVLARIRKERTLLELPVIMITAGEARRTIARAFALGANDFVTKPVDLPVLRARIQAHTTISRLSQRLEEEKRFSQNVVESISDIVFVVDGNQRITLFNDSAERTFGHPAGAILGQPAADLYVDPSEGAQLFDIALEQGFFFGETRCRKKNGEEFYVFQKMSVLQRSGQAMGLVIVAEETTEKRKIEAERKRIAEVKDEFFRIASHDLKNPLTALALVGGALKMPGLRRESRDHFILVLEKNVAVMQEIIEDFLDFGALEDGELRLELGHVDLPEIARRVIDANMAYARDKKIEIKLQLVGSVPRVAGDPFRLRQVLYNLVNNAIKFSQSETGIEIFLRPEGEGVLLEVVDSGPGLSDEDMGKVFQRYQRLSAKPTGGEKSSRLGLAISKKLIEQHGGRIGVWNNVDEGATFWFWLPASSSQS